ncbi:peptidase M22, glycoprotease [Gloeophyllum trabeum ATCC 11539]|uniref:N(6)-L-threonylcarbamoyladenine synthase n=1 Tax=Gloeophyllum trabeum (strain ATCC 11539 / FP-39264 / Madison 617) TaxID=670483 RepID=S7RW85_GLOTA|nr:peptidase M22, glycoprotease [Gloeophyllum trabeum ATCC 11539]EPQ57559.1 peptidase M22, glycoprotease [Gloeophyllum trabeum ATCC 11539]
MLRCAPRRLASLRCTSNYSRYFTVLALESSADDTCAAVVTSERQILSNVVVSQNELHASAGGIHPYVAIAGHQRNMPGAIRRALEEAKIEMSQVDGIAFTRGPGIGGCLSVSSNAAKNLAAALNKPLVGVHHMQAHALTPLLTTPKPSLPHFPFLTLLVSGGHSLLVLASSLTKFEILATTGDESVGRAFDKVARMLGLDWGEKGYGAALEAFCAEGRQQFGSDTNVGPDISIPRPMPRQLAFSFSSLHSSVERFIHARGGIQNLDTRERWRLAMAFQEAAVAQLEEKVELALGVCAKRGLRIGDVVVSGGVASNMYLRSRLHECLSRSENTSPINLLFPPPNLCRDNAAMIAWAAMHRFLAGDLDEYSIEHRAKWSIEDI